MPIPISPHTGHTARALRFFREAEIWFAMGVAEPWPDDANPPESVVDDANVGRISVVGTPGPSLANVSLQFNQSPFSAGITSVFTANVAEFTVQAQSSSTYKVLNSLGTALTDASGADVFTVGSTARKDLITGLSLKVSGTLAAGEQKVFRVDGVVGYKRVESRKLVIQKDDGEIEYAGGNWTEISEADAYDKRVRHVFVEAVARYEELPFYHFRQIGVLTGLQAKTVGAWQSGTTYPLYSLVSHAGNTWQALSATASEPALSNSAWKQVSLASVAALLPQQVAHAGALELLANDTLIIRSANKKESLRAILEF